jgi:hypothetical protein
MKTPPTKPKIEPYEAIIKVMGRTSKSTGKTIGEAILGLKVGIAKGVAVLTLKHGKNSRERILNHTQVARLFNTRGTTQAIYLKNITNLFEGI